MSFDISSLMKSGKDLLAKSAAFGRKNAPILMTGSSIAIGWFAVYLFWKESRNADKRIAYEERKLAEEENSNVPVPLPKKEKVVIYLEYCWMALALGVTSTGLAIAGQKLSMDRLAEMYVMTQFLTDKAEKSEKKAEKFKEELNPKKVDKIEKEAMSEDFTDEEILEAWNRKGAKGNIVVLDHVLHSAKRMDMDDLDKGIYDANDELRKRLQALKEKYLPSEKDPKDPFYVKEGNPFINDEEAYYTDLHSSLDLAEFLKKIGMVVSDSFGIRIGEVMEFRFYGGKNPIPKNQICKKFREFYIDQGNGEFKQIMLVDLDYTEYLCQTQELTERNPL